MNILCIGAGYVGGPTMVVMADKCPSHQFIVADINEQRIAEWNSDNLPIYEPGLDEIVKRVRGKNLHFTTNTSGEIPKADIIFISVNTPTKTFGAGRGRATDLQSVETVARLIKKHATSDTIVVEKSTLPVRTAEAIKAILGVQQNPRFDVLSNPEFLAEGTAVADLLQPDRVLIGCEDAGLGHDAARRLASLYLAWVPAEKIITANVWSSELSKLAANAFLAQRVSSINSIAEVCERTGADVDEIARAIGMDQRIGPKFLKAGIGFGGSCFKKDILNLVYIAETLGLHEVAEYWQQVVDLNMHQQERLVRRMLGSMFNTMAGKRIAVFGFAFKADTGDTRESPAIRICKGLLEEHASVRITDPKALGNAKRDMGVGMGAAYFSDPYVAAKGAHAIIVATDWSMYEALDWFRIYDSMERPAVLFDGRNCLDHEGLKDIGFDVRAIGKRI